MPVMNKLTMPKEFGSHLYIVILQWLKQYRKGAVHCEDAGDECGVMKSHLYAASFSFYPVQTVLSSPARHQVNHQAAKLTLLKRRLLQR